MNWILCIFIVLFSGCQQKPQESHYTEIVVQAPQVNTPSVPADPHAGLEWAAPQGWQQEAGGGMRLVTFHLLSDTKAIDCYIIALSGPAGGLEANLQRWLGQLGLQASDDNVNMLIASAQSLKTKDGLEVKVFDFAGLQPQASPSDKSMLAAMIALDKTTVFIKMTGSIGSVKQNKDNFLKLIGSIRRIGN